MSSMLNFLRDFISEVLHNFRRRGFVNIMFFDGGAVSVGVTIFALANMGGSSSTFVSGFGMGITSIGTLGLMSSLYENNMSLSRVVGYFFYEGGALQAGVLIYSLSHYGPPECRIPALSYIGIGVGCIGLFFALVTLRQMAVLYNDESIQILRDLRRIYASQNSIRYRKTRRRRSIVRSLGLQLRVLAWNLRRRQLRESLSTAEEESTEMPQESDSNSSEHKDGAEETSTEASGRRESLFSGEELHAETDANPDGRTGYPLDEESQIRGRREGSASNKKHQKVQSASGQDYASTKDKYETCEKDVGSQVVRGARKKVYYSKKTLKCESKETHGAGKKVSPSKELIARKKVSPLKELIARKKISPSKELTTKTRAERQPIAELRATRDRSPGNATLEADDLRSLEQVFGVSPPRKLSPEPMKKRKVDSGGINPQKTKIQTSLKKEDLGGSSESRQKGEQTGESKSDKKQVELQLEERSREKDIEVDAHERERLCFDHFDMKQEINSAVEELVAILKTFIKPTPESNLDFTRDEREMGYNAEVTEINLDNNSNAPLTREHAEVSQNSSTGEDRQVFRVEGLRESRRLYPISVEEYRVIGPTVEVIKVILGGCSEESQNASEDSVPEGGHTTEALAAISGQISDSHSMSHLESVDMHQQNKSPEEMEVGVLDVSSKTLSGLDANEGNLEECVEDHGRREPLDENVKLSELHPVEDSVLHVGEPESVGKSVLYHGEGQHVKESAESSSKSELLEEKVKYRSETRQPMEENVLHRGEIQPIKDSVALLDESQAVEENVLNRDDSPSVVARIESSSKPQFSEERVEYRSESCQPMKDNVLLGETQPLEQSVVLLVESQAKEKSVVHRDESQPVEEHVASSGEPQPLEEHGESSRVLSERVECSSETSQPKAENLFYLGELQRAEDSVAQRDESQPVRERAASPGKPHPLAEHVEYHNNAPQPIGENVPCLDNPQSAEDSVILLSEFQPAEDSVPLLSEPQPAEFSMIPLSESQPSEGSVLLLSESQPAEDSVLFLSEPRPAEDSVLLLREPQPADDSVPLLSEPPPAEFSMIPLSESQPAEDSVLLLSEPQPAEDTGLLLSEPQPAEDTGLLLSEPQPAEDTGLLLSEP